MQKELFEMSGSVIDASKISEGRSRWIERFRVTLRLDHLLMFAILALVLYVLVFSFGVEKGKRFALEELEAEKVKREQMAQELAVLKPSPDETRGEGKQELPSPAPSPALEKPKLEKPPPLALGKYTIQVIAFTTQARAEKEVGRLEKLGYTSFVIPHGRFFQVCVEAFEHLSEAREKLLKLRAEGFAPPDAFVRPLQGQITI